MTREQRRALIVALRRAGRHIEERGCMMDRKRTGLCHLVYRFGAGFSAYTQIMAFVRDGDPVLRSFYAYPKRREYDAARALAAYVLAEYFEAEANA